MSHVIIGTAGHIDHGKTTLIKRLTGIETDRLEEEKRRGITIDLGFAFFDLPSGKRAGIVDVPGHERFIKNMLAGVSGIDLVLLVIAADEGVMPQTQEHLDILSLLEVKKGIVVLTKGDLVEPEWLEMVKEEIKEKLKNTFLAEAPMVAVSAVSGQGIEALVKTIDELVETVPAKRTQDAARLPVDRVFTMTGFGTVVTGTLTEGILQEGQTLNLFPSGLEVKVRKLQVHSQEVATAFAGQRVAVNLSNVKKTDIHRGDVLAAPNSLKTSHMIDVEMKLLDSYHREIPNWTRLRLYQGTKEVLCRLVLLDREVVKPGETCYAQLRLEEAVAFKYNDRFVLRFYSPLETIGGGKVLDPNAIKHKRFKEEVIEAFIQKQSGDHDTFMADALYRLSPSLPNVGALTEQSGIVKDEVLRILDSLIDSGMAVQIGENYLHMAFIEELAEDMIKVLNDFHAKNPLKVGMGKEELRTRIFKASKVKIFDELLNLYMKKVIIKLEGQFVSLGTFEIELSQEQLKKKNLLLDTYLEVNFSPINTAEQLNKLHFGSKDQPIIDYCLTVGDLVKLDDGLLIHKKWLEEAKSKLTTHFETHDTVELGEFRDLLGTSRKVAVLILEYFDNIKFTVRNENQRRLK